MKTERKYILYIYDMYCMGWGKLEGAHRGQWDSEVLETLAKGFRPIDRDNSSLDRNNSDGQDMQVIIVCLGQSCREGCNVET